MIFLSLLDAAPVAESTIVATETTSPDGTKKRKTKKVDIIEDSVTMEVVEETEKKKGKKGSAEKSPKKVTADEGATTSTAMSADDLKSKRAGRAGDKKKEKVVSKGKGKRAKDALLGKKAGQS